MFRRIVIGSLLFGLTACLSQFAFSQDNPPLNKGYLDAFSNPPKPPQPDAEKEPVMREPASITADTQDNESSDAIKELDGITPSYEYFETNAEGNFENYNSELLIGDDGTINCDCKKQQALAKAVAGSHKGVFWKNNFDYLCDPCYDGCYLGDNFKRMCVGNGMTLDVGGSYRLRYHYENNMRRLGLTGNDDEFVLHQTRLYGDLHINDRFRTYIEMIDAVSNGENLLPRGHEENRTDLLNLFADIKLFETCCGDLTGRIGRQELIYGNQRLVSPLPWANSRRTFEGGSLFWKGQAWDVDAFWTHPVTNVTNQFDNPDRSREFMGLYSSYHGCENETYDFYYLRFLETDGAGFDYNTFGARVAGSRGSWLWEHEAAYQFGNVGANTQAAWMYTLGMGHKLDNVCWTPTLWAYFDFATGDANGNGFHHLFPLGHKYLGFMDLFGRRNIEDFNMQLSVKPTEKLKLLAWWHLMHLQNGADVPYNVNMSAYVATPGGSSYLGQELDLLASYNFTPRTNVVLGYSHFFEGDFYRTNPTPAPSTSDADFFYLQFTQEF